MKRSSKMTMGAAALAAVLFAGRAHAASLYLSSPASTLNVGQTFSVTLDVSSPDQAMNAVSADLSFPSDKLRVLSVSQVSSIVNFWVQQPAFSNAQTTGDVVLQGVVLTPGYTGAAGKVVNVVFQAIGPGSATVSFSSGSVLANDGKGTNILNDMTGKSFTISAGGEGSAAAPPVSGTQPTVRVSMVPAIADGEWHNTTGTARFSWNIPSGATGVWYDFTKDPSEMPAVTTAPSGATSASYDLSSAADGTWYFLISAETNGIWSPVVAKAVKLDRTPPQPFAITRADVMPTDSRPVFAWSATDALSGIAGYEVKIGGGDWFDASDIQGGGLYVLPFQAPGNDRTIEVRAYDRAGNFTDEGTTFSVGAAGCVANPAWCAAEQFAAWNWWWMLIILAAIGVAYAMIFRLLRWKRRVLKELAGFREEIARDVRHRSGGEKIEEDIKEEIRKIDRDL